MKLNAEYESLVLTTVELAALARQPGLTENALSLVPAVEPKAADAILAEFARLSKEQRDNYSRAIAMLAAPSQVVRLHYSVADSLVTRLYLAWRPESKDAVAALALTDGNLAVSLQPADKLDRMLADVLAVNTNLLSANLNVPLSAAATIVLVAVMDYFHYAHHFSMLTHTAPAESFSRHDVMERLADAASDDFRWPLLLLDKVLPAEVAGSLNEAAVTAALEELCQAGLLGKNEAEDNKPELVLYSLTGGAETISDSLLHDVSKAALSVSSPVGDGAVGHEAMLLVRGASYLWLFGLGARQGLVASIDTAQFSEVLQKFLAPPAKMPAAAVSRAEAAGRPSGSAGRAAEAKAEVICSKCGTKNPAEAKFCAKCGAAFVATPKTNFCPKCGDPVKAGENFCDKCGLKLS